MSWFEILKFYIFYHSTTEEGLNAFNNGEPIKEGTFMSKIKEGARFRRSIGIGLILLIEVKNGPGNIGMNG